MKSKREKVKLLPVVMSLLVASGTMANGDASASAAETNKPVYATNLEVDSMPTPLGIDVEKPVFSWQMNMPKGKRGYSQTAYQIVVKDENGKIVWDSEKVKSDSSAGIMYKGKELQATTKYSWAVTVWDQNGKASTETSWFETGLMNPDSDLSAWDGAEWIGGDNDDLVLHSQSLNVFKINYSLQLDQATKTNKASFILGANDPRLMDKNKNIYGIENGKNESYMKFELDVTKVDGSTNGLAKLNVYRAGYKQGDSSTIPLKSYNVPLTLINNENKYEKHDFHLWGNSGVFTVYVDGTGAANRIAQNDNLNPIGSGGNYISFPMVGDIGFSVEANQKASYKNVEVKNHRAPSNTLFTEDLAPAEYTGIYREAVASGNSGLSIEDHSYVLEGDMDGAFVVADPSRNSMPMLRTEFTTQKKKIESARVYATARGIYELYLNGKRVGNDYFNPGLTQYNKNHMYQTYDVTDMLKSNKTNAFGAMLGEGWWSGAITFNTSNWNFFGDRQSLLAKLVITYSDGTEEVITTNPDWKYNDDGPIQYSSFFQGEAYDATKESEIQGWTTSEFNDADWEEADAVPLNKTTTAGNLDYKDMKLTGQVGENATVVDTLTAVDVKEVRPGVFVYDMGQNMVGVPKITLADGKEGQKITMRFAEVLYPDLPESGDNVGMIMQENLRAALVQDTYTAKEGKQVIEPHFTFHGYRYVEITGIDEALPLKAVQGNVISSVKDLSSSYETSNESVNKLWENITWSMRGNFLSIPTDTPARNERMGWNGDISVFARTSTYLSDVNQFMRRHNLANRDMQAESGRYADVAPVGNGFGGILWGSAGLTVPWETYQQYGDLSILEEHYDSMKKYMSYLDTRVSPTTGLINEGPLGDWLSPENNKTENTLLWSAYHAYDLEIMAKAAEALGRQAEADTYWEKYEERKALFNTKFVDPETKKTIKSTGALSDSQASYAVPLALGIFNEENTPYAAAHLAEAVKRENVDDTGGTRPSYSLMTGFIGTAAISKALSDNGYSDVAYRLLQQTSYPSWLYSVENGATTIWERLNSYTVENGFGGNNSMNSFNHYSFGAVGAWMYNYSLGIERDPESPGFKHFILQPTPDPDGVMTWAEGHYDSVYGRINSAWSVEGDTLTYKATVPANTTATVYIPTNDVSSIKEGKKPIQEVSGIEFVESKDGKAVYKLHSGSYEFTSSLSKSKTK
ncbi:family 78 glycoside hydrolase catalytic domain [Domibacillus sp. PGB-M46]|uniref:family 78 glycoside hydrolase catalytic domain n=1 Tax=Domibacillus sp. PGB-M46 TaxID=2910255 RepID=UPI001F5687A4|nr:family 78 glycoside hydrolase catalytic domain [Domibacillus sp. PGB-M46]MCI2256142.1 family 78 glycoside hydrolase catalytic domain [Domibacillus sp. PGB-M46]